MGAFRRVLASQVPLRCLLPGGPETAVCYMSTSVSALRRARCVAEHPIKGRSQRMQVRLILLNTPPLPPWPFPGSAPPVEPRLGCPPLLKKLGQVAQALAQIESTIAFETSRNCPAVATSWLSCASAAPEDYPAPQSPSDLGLHLPPQADAVVQAAGSFLAECVLQSLAGAIQPAPAAAPEGAQDAPSCTRPRASCTQSRAAPDSDGCPDRQPDGLPGGKGGRSLSAAGPPRTQQDPPAGELQWAARNLRMLESLCSCNTLLSLKLCLGLTCSRPDSQNGSSVQGATAAAQALAAVGGALEAALEAAALRPSEPSLQPSPELLRVVAQSGAQLAAFAVWHRKAIFHAAGSQERTADMQSPPGCPKLAGFRLQPERLRKHDEAAGQEPLPDAQLAPATAHLAAAAVGVLSGILAAGVLNDSLAGAAASKLNEVLPLLAAAPPALHATALSCCREASAALAAAAARSGDVRRRLAGAGAGGWSATAELLRRWLLADAGRNGRRPATRQQQQASEQLAQVSRLVPTAAALSLDSSSAAAAGTERHSAAAAAASGTAAAAAARMAAEAAAAALLEEVDATFVRLIITWTTGARIL